MKKTLFLLALLLSVPMLSTAQVYSLAERSNPWNQGRNINGLRKDSTTVSYAELYGQYTDGGFHQHHEAGNTWKAGLIAESMLHLDKMSLKGLFGFEHQQSYQHCGSMFVRQDYYPVNIIEFTPGNKSRQQYTFDGGLTYDIYPEWRIGGKLAFTSMNYSKLKDLRHTTYLLDLSLAPSFLWHRGDFSFGMSYLLSKNSESVKATQIGETADDYMVFLDKGLRYGAYENWEGNGVHLKEPGVNGFPVKEILNGVAFQFGWKDLYIDAEYVYGKGKIGEKDFIWFEFPSHSTKVFVEYQLYRPRARHHFRLGFQSRYLENMENALEKKPEGGVTTVQKYASNRILTEERYSWKPEYEVVAKQWRLRWNFTIQQASTLSSQIFPYLCSDKLIGGETALEGAVHLWRFELGLGIGFGMEKITQEKRTVAQPEGTSEPVRIDVYDTMWRNWRETPKLNADLSLRYNIWRGIYVEAAGTWLRAFLSEEKASLVPQTFKDLNRWSTQLKIGLNF